jgi:hypothetical protein
MQDIIHKAVNIITKGQLYLIGMMVLMLIDTSLSSSYCINACSYSLASFIPIFFVVAAISFIIQYLLIRKLPVRRNAGTNVKWKWNRHSIILFQLILSALIGVILVQIVYISYYSTSVLSITIILSYSLAFGMLGFLAFRFFSWFRSIKNYVILLYALASATLAVNAVSTLLYATLSIEERPQSVQSYSILISVFSEDPTVFFLSNASMISFTLSFILMWCATVLTMAHYAKRIGRKRYWIIVSIPLIYYSTQFLLPLLSVYPTLLEFGTVSTTLLFTLLFTFSKPVGGILFGIAFWNISKKIQSEEVRNYMKISSYGLVLLFTSNQASLLINTPYPPFGVITSSVLGLASFFVLIGIYSSAVSLSLDSKLRQSIRDITIQESYKFLDSIGAAQTEQQIRKKVIIATKAKQFDMVQDTGISSSLSEDDISHYILEVIKEVEKVRKSG